MESIVIANIVQLTGYLEYTWTALNEHTDKNRT